MDDNHCNNNNNNNHNALLAEARRFQQLDIQEVQARRSHEEISTLDVLATFVSEAVLHRFAANPELIVEPEITLFEGAVLFADISGFTQLTEELANENKETGAEALTTYINAYFSALIEVITAHGGVVERFAGDALIAVFAHDYYNKSNNKLPSVTTETLEISTLRAIQCGMDIQARLGEYYTNGVRLTLHAAVGAGKLFAHHVGGFNGEWIRVIQGQPIISIGKAISQSKSGEVVVLGDAYELAKDRCKGSELSMGCWLVESVEKQVPIISRRRVAVTESMEPGIRSFILKGVQERIDAGQTKWMAELRNVSIVFINSKRYDTDDHDSTFQEAIRAIQNVLHHFEGAIANCLADDKGKSLVACFGAPYAHEDDPIRAVSAALEIHSNLLDHGIKVSIGVTTGRAFIGSVGSPCRQEYTVMGDVVNLAARLINAAAEGILCDVPTQALSYTHIEFENHEPIFVKGKQNKIEVYVPRRLLDQRAQILRRHQRSMSIISVGSSNSSGSRSSTNFDSSDMIFGRDAEMKLIKDEISRFMSTVQFGSPTRVIVFEGDAGYGKSLLISSAITLAVSALEYEFDKLADTCKCINAETVADAVIVARGDELEKNTPFFVTKQILPQILRFPFQITGLSTMSVEDRSERVRAMLKEEQRTYAALLNKVMSGYVYFEETTASRDYTSKESRTLRVEKINEILITLLKQLLEPVFRKIIGKIMFFEDLHAFDEESLKFIRLMSSSIPSLLIFATSRPEDQSLMQDQQQQQSRRRTKKNIENKEKAIGCISSANNSAVHRIRLRPLTKDEVKQFVIAYLETNIRAPSPTGELHSLRNDNNVRIDIHQPVIDLIFEKSQGNPHFVKEIIHSLIDMDALTTVDPGSVTPFSPSSSFHSSTVSISSHESTISDGSTTSSNDSTYSASSSSSTSLLLAGGRLSASLPKPQQICMYRFADGHTNITLPDSVQGFISSKISKMSPNLQLVLKVASVIGRQFSDRLLTAIFPVEQEKPNLAAYLQELVKKGFIERFSINNVASDAKSPLIISPSPNADFGADDVATTTGPTQQIYIFKNVVAQQASYNQMLISQRRPLHLAIFRWYSKDINLSASIDEELHQERILMIEQHLTAYYPGDDHDDHHMCDAEDVWKAVTYLHMAGDIHLQGFNFKKAAQSHLLGLKFLRHLPSSYDLRAKLIELELQIKLGHSVGRDSGLIEHDPFARAMELCPTTNPRYFDILLGKRFYDFMRGESTKEQAYQLLEFAKQMDDANMYILAYKSIAQQLFSVGEFEPDCNPAIEAGLAIYRTNPRFFYEKNVYERFGGRDPCTVLLSIGTRLNWIIGDHDKCMRYFEEGCMACETYMQHSASKLTFYVLSCFALALRGKTSLDLLYDSAKRARAIAIERGFLMFQHIAEVYLCFVQFNRIDTGRRIIRKGPTPPQIDDDDDDDDNNNNSNAQVSGQEGHEEEEEEAVATMEMETQKEAEQRVRQEQDAAISAMESAYLSYLALDVGEPSSIVALLRVECFMRAGRLQDALQLIEKKLFLTAMKEAHSGGRTTTATTPASHDPLQAEFIRLRGEILQQALDLNAQQQHLFPDEDNDHDADAQKEEEEDEDEDEEHEEDFDYDHGGLDYGNDDDYDDDKDLIDAEHYLLMMQQDQRKLNSRHGTITRFISKQMRQILVSDIESCFEQAAEIARTQHAKQLELRAVMSMTRLRLRQYQHQHQHHGYNNLNYNDNDNDNANSTITITDEVAKEQTTTITTTTTTEGGSYNHDHNEILEPQRRYRYDRLREAATMLKSLYARFSSGFELSDLVEAKELIAQLDAIMNGNNGNNPASHYSYRYK